jgi:hypothetical protein
VAAEVQQADQALKMVQARLLQGLSVAVTVAFVVTAPLPKLVVAEVLAAMLEMVVMVLLALLVEAQVRQVVGLVVAVVAVLLPILVDLAAAQMFLVLG